jgi:inhibitor of KinA
LALTVFYDALDISYEEIAKSLLAACELSSLPRTEDKPRNHVIPVEYDGPDLDAVAAATRLSTSEVISLHTAREYTVDLLGFVPGFAYLSELDPLLQLPRRAEPRPRVPAGSVAIAASQTGVYPLDTPGGWHIIGHTGTAMFDPGRDPPALLRAGDTVRFERSS